MSKTIKDDDEDGAAAEAKRRGQGQHRYKVHLVHVVTGEEKDIGIDAFSPEEACATAERQQPDFEATSADFQLGDSNGNRMRPRDSAQFHRPARGPMITDASGGTMGLHQPGYRVSSGGNIGDQWVRDGAKADLQEIYDAYAVEQSEAWRSPTGFGTVDPIGAREGDVCTINGSPGHLRMADGKLTCTPDQRRDAMTTDMAEVYAAYNAEISQRWKGPGR